LYLSNIKKKKGGLNKRFGLKKKKKNNIMFFQNQTCLFLFEKTKKFTKRLRTKTICNNRVFESLIITMVV